MNFSNEIVKKTIKSGNKVQEIKMQRDLFGRLLGLSLDYKIDMEKILCYPVTSLPMSMFRVDGSLYQTDKSAIIVKWLEKQQKCTDAPTKYLRCSYRCWIFFCCIQCTIYLQHLAIFQKK